MSGDWDEDETPKDDTGYTIDPEEDTPDDPPDYAAAAAPPPPAPEAPPPQPVAAVVDIESARRAKRVPVPPLPDVTGIASFRVDYPRHGTDILLTNLRESALTDETIEVAKLTCLHHKQWAAYGFKSKPNWTPSDPNKPFAYSDPESRAIASGLLLPFFAPGATEPHAYRLRPEFPVKVPPTKPGQKPRFKKYDQPYGTELLVYTPPMAACISQLRGTTPLYWTEGEKKALLLAQLGHCVVGLTGVESWSEPGSKSSRIHPYIAQHYGLANREHVIVFDSDSMVNPSVLSAMRKLAGILLQLGATQVTSACPPLDYLPHESGQKLAHRITTKGIDDYAHRHGLDATQRHLTETRDEIAAVAPRVNEQSIERVSAFAALTQERKLVIPSPYSVDENGAVWKHTGFEDNDKLLVSPRPILVTRLFTDMHRNGEYRAELQFQTARGTWQAITVPRAMTGSRALAPELRRAGALVDDTSIPEVIKWLTAWEARNGGVLEPVRCVDRAGWCDGQFALGPAHVFAPDGVTPVAFDMHYDQAKLFGALGNTAENVGAEAAAHAAALQAACAASDDCALAIFAALTAPLLRPFGLPNFAVHLCGDSSRGKTSMLRCAASVYGDPTNAAWVPSWNSTITGLEQHAVQLCDLPLCFDEAGAGDPEAIQTAIYMLVNGVGRQRSTKELTMRRTLTWQTVVISSGERELANEQAATGAQVRVISLPITGFGELDAAGVDAVRDRCASHAGALGVVWLPVVVGIASEPTTLLAVKAQLAGYRQQLREIARQSGNPLNGRIADYFAAMMLAEAIASGMGLGEPEGATVLRIFEQRCSDSGGDGGSAPATLRERVLEALEGWPDAAPHCFPQLTANVETGAHEVSVSGRNVVHGYIREDKAAVHFLPNALRDYLTSRGLPWTKALMRDLHASGRLVRDGDGRHATARIQVNGRRVRCFTFLVGSEDRFAP